MSDTTNEAAPSPEVALVKYQKQIHQICHKYRWCNTGGIDYDDIYQAACMGMVRACTSGNFDPSRGVKFITYAALVVRTEIMKHIDWMARTVRIPVSHKRSQWGKGIRTKLHSSVSLDTGYQSDFGDHDEPSYDSSYNPLNKMAYEHNFPSLDDNVDEEERLLGLRRAIMRRFEPGRNRTINMRYWFAGDVTQAELARQMGLSRERVRQICEEGFQVMKAYGARYKLRGADRDQLPEAAE